MTRASDTARLIGAGATINDGTTITTADNTTQLTLKSTDADGSSGPLLDLTRDSGSPADGDVTGIIRFRADNDAGEVTTTGQIVSLLNDASDGTEDGEIKIETMIAGSAQPRIDILPSETVFNEGSVDVDFRVETDGDANTLFVEGSTNRVGIGTSSPTAQLQCEGGAVVFKNAGTNISGTVHHYVNSVSSGAYRVRFDSNDTVVGSIGVGTSSTAFNTSSDYRLKENVTYDFDATTRVKKLKPARFSWIKDKKSDATQDGFIAHEVSDAVPEAVTGTKDAMMALEYQRDDTIPEGKKLGDFKGYSTTEIEPQTLDYSKIVPLLTKSLQEALARIDTLEAEVAKLKE